MTKDKQTPVDEFAHWYDRQHGNYEAFKLMRSNPEKFDEELTKYEYALVEIEASKDKGNGK